MPKQNLQRYYDLRAEEYERIYYRPEDPVRQEELAIIGSEIQRLFSGKQVLEIACGSGYWTEILAGAAESVIAIDTSPEMLKLASQKDYRRANVEFLKIDAYQLQSLDQRFTGGMANFWFSHVPKNQIGDFLNEFHGKLQKGSPVLIADNILVHGIGGEFVERKGENDTYKLRELEDGSQHLVLKNYYCAEELQALFEQHVNDLSIAFGQCYWWITYRVK